MDVDQSNQSRLVSQRSTNVTTIPTAGATSSIKKFDAFVRKIKSDAKTHQVVNRAILDTLPGRHGSDDRYAMAMFLSKMMDLYFQCDARDLTEILWDYEGIYTLRIMVDNQECIMLLYLPGNDNTDSPHWYVIDNTVDDISQIGISHSYIATGNETFRDEFERIFAGEKVFLREVQTFFETARPPSPEVVEEQYGDYDDWESAYEDDNGIVKLLFSVINGCRLNRRTDPATNSSVSIGVQTPAKLAKSLSKFYNMHHWSPWTFDRYSEWEYFYRSRLQKSTGLSSIGKPSWTTLEESQDDITLYRCVFLDLNLAILVKIPKARKPWIGRSANAKWRLMNRSPLEIFPRQVREIILKPGLIFNGDRFRYKETPNSLVTYVVFVNIETGQTHFADPLQLRSDYDDDPLWITKTTDENKVIAYNVANPI
jgi:hypothetical protein